VSRYEEDAGFGAPESSAVDGVAAPTELDRARFLRDGVINNSGHLVSLAISVLLVPIMMNALGLEAYGLWLAAMAISGTLAGFDFGLGWGVIREVGAVRSDADRTAAAGFVQDAGVVYMAIGIVGGAVVAVLGYAIRGWLQLSPANAETSGRVFLLVGLLFFLEQTLATPIRVLTGLRRFDVINLLAIAGALLRAGGVVGLIALGSDLVTIVAWHCLTSAVMMAAANAFVGTLAPVYRFKVRKPNWKGLEAHIPFAAGSAAMALLGNLIWQAPQLFIGVFRGSAMIAPYHVGQRFPLIGLGIIARMTAVLFPAMSEYDRARDGVAMREMLRSGTRSTVVLALPLFATMFIVAPALLEAWIGDVRPDTLVVFRVTAAAVFADAVCCCAYQVLWAGADVRSLIRILGTMLALMATIGYVLLNSIGIAGPAYALLVALWFGSGAFLYLGSKACEISAIDLVSFTLKGLLWPVVACLLAAFAITECMPYGGWWNVILPVAGAAAAYAGTLIVTVGWKGILV
jgi:O-antigen/teichoic acid export membrane protein